MNRTPTLMKMPLLLAGLFCLAVFSPHAHADDSIFPGTAFEQGEPIPEAWKPISDARPWERRAFSVVTEGDRTFARVTKPVGLIKVQRPVDPAWKTLELSFDVRLQDIQKGANPWDVPLAQLDFLDADGESLLTWQKAIWMPDDTDGWKTVTREYPVPEGAKTVEMVLGFKAKSGTADFMNAQATVKAVWDQAAYEAKLKAEAEAARKAAEAEAAKIRKAVEWEQARKAAEARPIGDWVRPAFEPIEMTKPLDPPPVTGKTYYVAPNGSNETGNGSKDKPWKTVQHGMNQLHPGDCLYLREGEYKEMGLTFPRSGKADGYITVAGYPGEKAVVGGGKGLCVFQLSAGSQWEPKVLEERAYFVFRDMTIDAAESNMAVRIIGPMRLEGYKDDVAKSRHMRHNIWVCNNDVIGGNGYESVLGASAGAHHIVISNNRIYDGPGGVNLHNYADGSIFEWNTVYDTGYDSDDAGAFKAMCPGVIVRYNKVYSNSRSSTSKRPGWAPKSQGGKQWRHLQGVTGIYLDWALVHPERNNVYPPELMPDDVNNYVYGNVSHNNNAGIYAFLADNTHIYDNIVYSNGRETTFGYVEGDPSKKKLIFGGPAGHGIAVTKSKNCKVYNNLIYDNQKAGLKIDEAPGYQAYDNVIFGNDMAQIYIDRGPLSFTLGYNTILDVPGKGPIVESKRGKQDTYATLDAYRAEFPYHDHGSKVIPAEEEPLKQAKAIYEKDDFSPEKWQAARKELIAQAVAAGVGAPPEIVPQAAYDPTESLQEPMPWKVPGVVEFENYDVGGPEVSFSDRDGDNRGGHYRQDPVDIKASDKASNGAIVGWAYDGEWMEYTIEVTEAGQYRPVLAYVAPGEGTRVRLSLDGEELTAVPQAGLPATDDWDDLGTYTFDPITLPKGDAVLRVTILAGPVDLDRMQFVSTNQAN